MRVGFKVWKGTCKFRSAFWYWTQATVPVATGGAGTPQGWGVPQASCREGGAMLNHTHRTQWYRAVGH